MKSEIVKVLIEIRGGLVVNVLATNPDLQYIVVNWDNAQDPVSSVENPIATVAPGNFCAFYADPPVDTLEVEVHRKLQEIKF